MAFGALNRGDPMSNRDAQYRDWQGGAAPQSQPQGQAQGQGQRQGDMPMPKSQSMPFSQYADREQGQNPQDQRRLPQGTGGGERGYGGLPDSDAPVPVDKTPKQSPRVVSAGQTPSTGPTAGSEAAAAAAAGANGPPGQNAGKKQNFDEVVELIAAQPQKTYVASPPELEMILARTSAGGQPK